MIKTSERDRSILEKHYSQLYCDYISSYFKEKKVLNIPQMIHCYTLYKFPQISESSSGRKFFLVDYGMYDFFYNLNTLSFDCFNYDCLLECYISLFAEQLFLSNEIDLCYDYISKNFLSNVEINSTITDYQNDIVKKTDLQELFIILHESAHFYVDINGGCNKHIKYSDLMNIYKSDKFDISILDDVATEIVCDYESVSYILRKISEKESLINTATSCFQTITYVYILRLFLLECNSTGNLNETGLSDFSLRFHGIYFTFLEYIHKHNLEEYTSLLEDTYMWNLNLFKSITLYTRKFIDTVNSMLDRNNIISLSQVEKKNFIRNFLGLL